MEHVLTYMTFIPVAGMVVVLLLPSKSPNLIRWVSAAFTVPPLLMACWLYANFDPTKPGLQFIERAAWIPAYNIQYLVGVDGLSISMVLLTALLCFLCIFASWGIDKGVKGYFALFLLLDAGMMGVFVALDFFLFFIFWEVMLLPMYFLIGIWGGPRREYAAIKFFLYTLFGSGLMLLAILALYFTSEPHTFDMTVLISQANKFGTQTLSYLAVQSVGVGVSSTWFGWRFSSGLRSKFRPFRFTLGCRTPTSKRPRRSPSSWLAYCSRWAPTGSCGSIFRCCRRRQLISLSGSWAR